VVIYESEEPMEV